MLRLELCHNPRTQEAYCRILAQSSTEGLGSTTLEQIHIETATTRDELIVVLTCDPDVTR